ncbi:MAG: hypothetical protein H0W88_09500 [Parachlamydiaceae bacterium]|nr:hypothetical protein [Parachlamydiaceae bacterium]
MTSHSVRPRLSLTVSSPVLNVGSITQDEGSISDIDSFSSDSEDSTPSKKQGKWPEAEIIKLWKAAQENIKGKLLLSKKASPDWPRIIQLFPGRTEKQLLSEFNKLKRKPLSYINNLMRKTNFRLNVSEIESSKSKSPETFVPKKIQDIENEDNKGSDKVEKRKANEEIIKFSGPERPSKKAKKTHSGEPTSPGTVSSNSTKG